MSTESNALQPSVSILKHQTGTNYAQQCRGLALIGTAAHLQVDRTPYRTAQHKEAGNVHASLTHSKTAPAATVRSTLPSTRGSVNITDFIPDVAIPAHQAAPARPAVASAEFISRLSAQLSCSAVLPTTRGDIGSCKSWYNIPQVSTLSLLLPVNAQAQHRLPASNAASAVQPAQVHVHSSPGHGIHSIVHSNSLLEPSSSNAAAVSGGTAAMPAATASAVAAAACKIQSAACKVQSGVCDRFHAILMAPQPMARKHDNHCQTAALPDSVPLPSHSRLEQLRHTAHMARLQQLAAPAKASCHSVSKAAAAPAGDASIGSFAVKESTHMCSCKEKGPDVTTASTSPTTGTSTSHSSCVSPTDLVPSFSPMIAAYFKSIDLASNISNKSNAGGNAASPCVTDSRSGIGEMSSIAAELAQLLGSGSSDGNPTCNLGLQNTSSNPDTSSMHCCVLPPTCEAANNSRTVALLPVVRENTVGKQAHNSSSGKSNSGHMQAAPFNRQQQQHQECSDTSPVSPAQCCLREHHSLLKPLAPLGLPDVVTDPSNSPPEPLVVTGLSSPFSSRCDPVGSSTPGTQARPVLAAMPDLFGALPVAHSPRMGRAQAGGKSTVDSNSTSYVVSTAVAARAGEIGGVLDCVFALVPPMPRSGISLCPWRHNPAGPSNP